MLNKFRAFAAAGMLLAGTLLMPQTMATAASTSSKFNMTYIYYGIGGDYINQVDAAKGALQMVAPSYFELNADGSLLLSKDVSADFVKAMHDRGLKVVPYLSNDWDRDLGRNALQQRDQLSSALADAVERYNLDGVDVDIENITEADRDAYTDFIRLLRAKLPAGKEVSAAVAPNPNGDSTGWAAAYDYKALANYVDYLMVMAYDESYPGDPTPGPVASLPFVERSIQSALKLVSPDKLVLGIPFYGRLWNQEDASFNGAGLSDTTVETLVARYNGTETYDVKSESVQATFDIHSGDPVSKVLGRELTPGHYTIWYENDNSLKAKLSLVGKYGLKGTGSWSLSQETAETWAHYSQWVNGAYFTDTVGHWAQDDINGVAEKGWMTGETDDTFAPDQELTRAEAATILVRAKGLSDAGVPSPASPFADVPPGHWAAQAIAVAAQQGYVDGVAAGQFAPDLPITREQMSALLVRLLGLQTAAVTAPPFMDVPAASWSAPAIAALSGLGIVDGFVDGTFRPQAPITRAQMAALLMRLAPRFAQ
jgi:spore germination protein YaaH